MSGIQRWLLPALSLFTAAFCRGQNNELPSIDNDMLRIAVSTADASLTVVDKRIGLEWRQQVRAGLRIAPDTVRVSPTSLSATVVGGAATYQLTVSLSKECAYGFDLVLDTPGQRYAVLPDYPFPFIAPGKGWYYVQNTSGEGMLRPLDKR